jgi:hypothetical protein
MMVYPLDRQGDFNQPWVGKIDTSLLAVGSSRQPHIAGAKKPPQRHIHWHMAMEPKLRFHPFASFILPWAPESQCGRLEDQKSGASFFRPLASRK